MEVSRPAVELENVVKTFGSERVLDGVNLVVPAGRTTVLIGASGAGKTLTIKHILGLLRPSRGVVRIEGKDLGGLSDAELNEIRRRMSVVLQGTLPFSCGLFFSLNVYDNVAYALRERYPRWDDQRIDGVTMSHLAMVGLKDRVAEMPDALSSGMCKRTAIARALALDARIMIIDDFDSGIDGVRLGLLCDLLQDAQATTGATLLVTTHDMTAARMLADYAAVIHEGRIVAAGEAEEVFGSSDALVAQLVRGEASGPIQLRT